MIVRSRHWLWSVASLARARRHRWHAVASLIAWHAGVARHAGIARHARWHRSLGTLASTLRHRQLWHRHISGISTFPHWHSRIGILASALWQIGTPESALWHRVAGMAHWHWHYPFWHRHASQPTHGHRLRVTVKNSCCRHRACHPLAPGSGCWTAARHLLAF